MPLFEYITSIETRFLDIRTSCYQKSNIRLGSMLLPDNNSRLRLTHTPFNKTLTAIWQSYPRTSYEDQHQPVCQRPLHF